jgi:hypothetical protein
MKIEFTQGGKRFEMERGDFEKATKSIRPGRIQKYSVLLHGKRYPIRQVVSAATGIPAIELTSNSAYRILKKFDFAIDVEE